MPGREKKPRNIANIFQISTYSRRKIMESAATIIGEENIIAEVIVNGRYLIAIKLKNVQTVSKAARMDKSKNVLRSICLVTAKGPVAAITVKQN